MVDAPRSGSDADLPQRRERAAIAAQACQTCRTRKSKCDEKRPRCSLCQRLGVECQYREPLPTKKDKTLVHILEAVTRLESKIDTISTGLPLSLSPLLETENQQGAVGAQATGLPASEQGSNRHVTDAHAIITWPSIYLHLTGSNLPVSGDLPHILLQGSAWFTHLQATNRFRCPNPNIGLSAVTVYAHDAQDVVFPWLNTQQSEIYAEAYLHTFNVIHPIIDAETLSKLATNARQDGYPNGNVGSVIVLIVYALGQLAMVGTLDEPITSSELGRSGVRGGSANDPPGLATFNEARKRMGLLAGEFTAEDLQMRLLAAVYYEAAGMHLEFWRTAVAASATCQVLVRSPPDWDSSTGEVLKRLYWICYLNEIMCSFDLDLPPTDLIRLQDEVPMLNGAEMATKAADDRLQHHNFFPALISLEQLMQEIHRMIIEPVNEQAKSRIGAVGPPMPIVRKVARRLDNWRSLLPRSLQWLDNEMFDFPNAEGGVRRPGEPLFALDQSSMAIRHRWNLDIYTAHLRSRFYYARHLLYQPFLYRMLHFPETMDEEDVKGAMLALKSAMMWPILMAPPRDKKRLIPFGFTWIQTCIGMLLILKMTRVSTELRNLCEEQIDPVPLRKTVILMLDWLRDMRQVDSIADWGWQMLCPLFQDPA